MYTLCISDRNNKQRRENATSELNKIGLDFEFFDAVMGKNMSKDELAAVSFPDTYLSPGEIGCSLSHVGCYEKFLESDEKSAVIFEDDIQFTEDMNLERLEMICNFIENQQEPAVWALYRGDYDYKAEREIFEGIWIHQAYGFFLAHGYIVNRQAAKAIKEVQTPISFEADAFKMFHFLSGMRIYSLSRDFVCQHDEDILPSSITAARYETGNRGVRKKKAFWAKFFAAPLTRKAGILWRRVYKHYLSDVKRKRFLQNH